MGRRDVHIPLPTDLGHGPNSHIQLDRLSQHLMQQLDKVLVVLKVPRQEIRRNSPLSGSIGVLEDPDGRRRELKGRRRGREEGEGVGVREGGVGMVEQPWVRR